MSGKNDAFLEEARLGPRARVLIECEEVPNLSRLRRRFREYVLTDLAHAVMLTEAGILAPERGTRLLEGLLVMYVWHSWEFGYVEVADGLAGTSSIMPQKKNPHSLERIKALAGQASGWLAGIMACQHGILSTDLDLTFADDALTPMGDATQQALELSAASVETLTVHSERMAEAAGAFWSTTSHLADELVRRCDLPFRAAHHVVGRFVRDSLAAGLTPAEVRAADLAKAGREMAATAIDMDDADLRRLLDARAFLDSRATTGSVHPEETRAHRARLAARLEEHRSWQETRKANVEDAILTLTSRARELARG